MSAKKEEKISKNPVRVKLIGDQPVTEDEFGGHRRVAKAIADTIQNDEGGKAIAVEGSWGTGKSSIIKMMDSEINDNVAKIFLFDAWSHQGDPLRRTFLEEITTFLKPAFNSNEQEFWEQKKKEKVTGKRRDIDQSSIPVLSSYKPILFIALAVFFPVALIHLGASLRLGSFNIWGVLLILGLSAVALVPTGILLWIAWKCRTNNKEDLASAGELISLWSKKTGETVKSTAHETLGPSTIEFQEYFEELISSYIKKSGRKLVIVLDNLDRVGEEDASLLWSTLRLFLECCERECNSHHSREVWAHKIWFIVPYDPPAAAALWKRVEQEDPNNEDGDTKKSGNENDRKDAKRDNKVRSGTKSNRDKSKPPSVAAAFFDKSFQVRFAVPPLHLLDWKQYLEQLVKLAIPELGTKAIGGWGSTDALHRVYRLSERISDTKRRPPSPRHLKLYVNDIVALVRQFGTRFPLDHLALFTLLRRQGSDVRLWLREGFHRFDPAARVMPDNSYVESLYCIYFGTEDTDRAKVLMFDEELREALLEGEAEDVRKIKGIPGFWEAIEPKLETHFLDEGIEQEELIGIVAALQGSEMDKTVPAFCKKGFQKFASRLLKQTRLEKLDTVIAESAGFLLQIAASPSVTMRTCRELSISTVNAKKDRKIDPDEWVNGVGVLSEVADDLKHKVWFTLPKSIEDAINILAAMGRYGVDDAVYGKIAVASGSEEFSKGFSVNEDNPWTEEKYNALVACQSADGVKFEESTLIAMLSERLSSGNIDAGECKYLIDGLLVLYPDSSEAVREGFGGFVNSQFFGVQVQKQKDDRNSIVTMLVVLVLARVGKPSGSDSASVQKMKPILDIIGNPVEHVQYIEEFTRFAVQREELDIIEGVLDLRETVEEFSKAVFEKLSEENEIGSRIPAGLFLEKFDDFAGALGDEVGAFAKNLLKSDMFRNSLSNREFSEEEIEAHCVLIEEGAFVVDAYKANIRNVLEEVGEERWKEEVEGHGNLYRFLCTCVGKTKDIGVPRAFVTAVEQYALGLCGRNDEDEVEWNGIPECWGDVYGKISPSRRKTVCGRVVDRLSNFTSENLDALVELLGEDLARAVGKAKNEALVRRVAYEIIGSDDKSLIRWLAKTAEFGTEFWEQAPKHDRESFSEVVKDKWEQTKDEDLKEILRKIAKGLNIELAEGAKESE